MKRVFCFALILAACAASGKARVRPVEGARLGADGPGPVVEAGEVRYLPEPVAKTGPCAFATRLLWPSPVISLVGNAGPYCPVLDEAAAAAAVEAGDTFSPDVQKEVPVGHDGLEVGLEAVEPDQAFRLVSDAPAAEAARGERLLDEDVLRWAAAPRFGGIVPDSSVPLVEYEDEETLGSAVACGVAKLNESYLRVVKYLEAHPDKSVRDLSDYFGGKDLSAVWAVRRRMAAAARRRDMKEVERLRPLLDAAIEDALNQELKGE